MRSSSQDPVVLVVEGERGDDQLTRLALERTRIPMRVESEADGDRAVSRLQTPSAESPLRLVIVSRLRQAGAHELVAGMRETHPRGTVAIVHLRSAHDEPPAPGADEWLVKPLDYQEYLQDVGAVARRWLTEDASRAS